MVSKSSLGISLLLILQQAITTDTDIDVDYTIDIDVMAMGQYLDQEDGLCNTYLGELLNIDADVRLNSDFGVSMNIVSDKRCIDDRKPEVNTAYAYYLFDMLGEIHVGHDKSMDQYIRSLDNNIFENRAISAYFKCPAGSFSKYTIVDDHSALRITWISPTVRGIRLGLAYIPNSSICRGSYANYTRDLFALGILYEGGWKNVTYGISSIGYIGRSLSADRHNVKSITFEGRLAYKGFEIGGRAIFDGSSLQKLDKDNADSAYSLDLSYTIKDTKFSIGHFISHRTDDTFETSKGYTGGIEHKIGTYNVFTQYKHLMTKGNRGNAVLLGVSWKFDWGN